MPSVIGSGNEDNSITIKRDALTNYDEIFLPIDIFNNGTSCLESISKYLRQSIGLRYCVIADLLNRDDRTIWDAHYNANRKSNSEFKADNTSMKIPLSIFRDRTLSSLEAITEYLKDGLNMRYCRIAGLLSKDQRTIWTVYSRVKRKRLLSNETLKMPEKYQKNDQSN